ncbi:hypothetical protein Clacol_000868 [Clathrus columnatus]|uniref:Uncharacterized protein n=1 Tax=Clathrus columnatus TaxID=1419009 RepID=A0AAV5A205_9AGAM|nr:hypothetical protein Clacol_000868 [Clathrus columnatus]
MRNDAQLVYNVSAIDSTHAELALIEGRVRSQMESMLGRATETTVAYTGFIRLLSLTDFWASNLHSVGRSDLYYEHPPVYDYRFLKIYHQHSNFQNKVIKDEHTH